MDKYINKEGKVGVLVSGGFGAGWSTWNEHEDVEFYPMKKTLVEFRLNNASSVEVEAYLEVTLDDGAPYMGGWEDVEVEWLKPGTQFAITEYDGSESLQLVCDLPLIA